MLWYGYRQIYQQKVTPCTSHFNLKSFYVESEEKNKFPRKWHFWSNIRRITYVNKKLHTLLPASLLCKFINPSASWLFSRTSTKYLLNFSPKLMSWKLQTISSGFQDTLAPKAFDMEYLTSCFSP